MGKNVKVERILDEIGERKHSDHLLKLKADEADDLDAKDDFMVGKKSQGQKTSDEDQRQKKFIDNEFTFSVKPRIIIKWMVILVVFVSVFYLGRLTATPSEVILEETPEIKEETSFITSISGFFTSVIPDFGEEESAEPAAESAETPATEPAAAETAEPVTESAELANESVAEEPVTGAASAEEAEEEVVTTYNNVELEFQDITMEWKSTWGKITKIKYKITNGEKGTIEPDHFVMIVAGYEENFEHKTIPLPAGSKSIKSGTAVSTTATVPSGFAYNEIEVGDLSNAIVTLQLYDATEKLINAKSKAFNMKGS